MNCQDIARILDEQDVDHLPAEELAAIQVHVAGCSNCARDWQIHAQLSCVAIPAVPSELRALYSPQRAGVTELQARRRSRFILIGTIAAVASAASMLAVQLTRSPAPVVTASHPDQVETAPMPTPAPAPPSEIAAVSREDVGQPATKAKMNPAPAAADQARLRIRLLPPRHDSTEAQAKPAIEAFHAALMQALRNSPAVIVEVSGSANAANDQPVNRVTVVSPRVTTLSSGEHVYQSGDGTSNWTEFGSNNGPQRWAVEVMLEPAIQKDPNVTSSLRLNVDSNGVPTGLSCSSRGIDINRSIDKSRGTAPSVGIPAGFNALMASCSSTERIVSLFIDALHLQTEPPSSETAQFIARLSDAAVPGMDRQRAFSELLNRSRQGGVVLNSTEVDAIAAYVNSLPPEQRAMSWLQLRGLRQPDLVVPLLAALQQDGDELVRLEALSTLLVNYTSDTRVRDVFEIVARQDASELVRMAVQRTISGDAPWQAYVSKTLADTGLNATQRMAPAMYDARSASYPEGFERLQSFLGSPVVTSQLLDIFQELRTESRKQVAGGFPGMQGAPPGFQGFRASSPQDGPMQNVIGLLNITNPAAALDLQIRILTEDPQPNSVLNSRAFIMLLDRRDDPRVSKVLDDIAAGKAGPQMRNELERQMATRPPPTN